MTTHLADASDLPATLVQATMSLQSHDLRPSASSTAIAVHVGETFRQQMTPKLGWGVSKVPLTAAGDVTAWPGAFGIRRDDNRAALGVVGVQYKPLQNLEVGDALDAAFGHLPASFRPRLVNAGALSRGSKVFAQFALPEEVSRLLRVPADRDSRTDAYLTLTNTHDGSTAAVLGSTAVRIVCLNTFRLANAKARVGGLVLKHMTKNVDGFRKSAETWLKETAAGYAMTGEMLRSFSARPMGVNAVKAAVNAILTPDAVEPGDRTRPQQAAVDAVIEMIEGRNGQFVPVGEVTAYSVLQSVTAYALHRKPARGELSAQTETRTWRVLTGDDTITTAFAVLSV